MNCLPMGSVCRQILPRSSKFLGSRQALKRIATDSCRSSLTVGPVLKHDPARAHFIRCTGIHSIHTCLTQLIRSSLPIALNYLNFTFWRPVITTQSGRCCGSFRASIPSSFQEGQRRAPPCSHCPQTPRPFACFSHSGCRNRKRDPRACRKALQTTATLFPCMQPVRATQPTVLDALASAASVPGGPLKDCDRHSTAPDVGGVLAFAFKAGFNLAGCVSAVIVPTSKAWAQPVNEDLFACFPSWNQ
ncbi:Uncharacterised protein [Comamonas testosteroni]|uniref:Uncharacterized protein n=1 Tax=Comamonas testosteroni TaxID=285 RepID=A0A8B4S4G0_COMTE|nr:Uncharacterised protein [Comamonas testosteroni]